MDILARWENLIAICVIITIIGLFAFFSLIRRNNISLTSFRQIPAFFHLCRAIDYSVESGRRFHLTLGDGGIYGQRGAMGLIGLSVAEKIFRIAPISDRPPLATTGDASLAILSHDVFGAGLRDENSEMSFDASTCQISGLTTFSYAAGTLPVIFDQEVSANLMMGSFGSEVALFADASARASSEIMGGSENLAAQAILFASEKEPLVGEEVFASGAYLEVNKMHLASLVVQDILRWMIITALLVGAALKISGVF